MSHQRAGLGHQSRVLHLHPTYWQLRAILQPGFSLRGTHQLSHTPRMFSNIGMVSRFHWLPISETRNWNRYSSKSNLYPVINYWYIFKLVQLFRFCEPIKIWHGRNRCDHSAVDWVDTKHPIFPLQYSFNHLKRHKDWKHSKWNFDCLDRPGIPSICRGWIFW